MSSSCTKNVVGLRLPSPVKHAGPDGGVESTYMATNDLFRLPVENEQYWAEVEAATVQSLQSRIALWDGIYQELSARKNVLLTDANTRQEMELVS